MTPNTYRSNSSTTQVFQNTQEEEHFLTLHETIVILAPNTDKDTTRKEKSNILHEPRHKSPQQNISNSIPAIYKENNTYGQTGLIPGM